MWNVIPDDDLYILIIFFFLSPHYKRMETLKKKSFYKCFLKKEKQNIVFSSTVKNVFFSYVYFNINENKYIFGYFLLRR